MLRIFTDSDTDITPKEAKEYGYTIISMPYIINGEIFYPYKDNEDDFDFHAFYDMLRKGVLPTTAALSPVEYMDYFEPVFKAGDDILYVHFSAAMSGTFNAMHLALEELKEKYPERKFYTVDTKGITICAYYTVRRIGQLYKKGASIDEILSFAEVEVDKASTYFYASDLKFFAKSGRVSGFKAFMGGIIGVKPIIYMSSEGKMGSIDKARGSKNTIAKIIDYMRKLQDNIKDHEIVIGHADAPHMVEELKEAIVKEFGDDLRIVIANVNPTAGSHCGPDTVGVVFHGIHR